MNNKTRTTILSTLNNYGSVDSYSLISAFGRKNLTKAFDNSVMRYIRRLHAAGRVKRTARGFYTLTAKGRRFVAKSLSN